MGKFSFLIALVLAASGVAAGQAPAPGAHVRYRVMPGEAHKAPPFFAVSVTYDPEQRHGGQPSMAWQLDVFAKDEPGTEPMLQVRAVTSRDPLAVSDEPLDYLRYQLRIPETGETYEYGDANNPGKPLLPTWGGFVQHFFPQPVRATRYTEGVPNTCKYLGHILTLREVSETDAWEEWTDVKLLKLDREMWIGTGRTFKDEEEHRLPQQPERQNYTYVPWTPEDYRTLIEAGFNYFALVPGIEGFLRAQPVFYRRGVDGDHPLRYPADLYRSNYVGPVMFIDEPSCIMTGDELFYNSSKYFSDATAMLMTRVAAEYRSTVFALERALKDRGVSFGDMRLSQPDFAAWETRYSTAYYQFAGGVAGFVHEGRYQLGEFNEFAKASTGLERVHTAEEMFRYIYAVMRGAARRFGADWGISIYGQADPELSPLAVTLAYDMGARYVWYWTSDHDHHLPWPEQLALTRILKQHAEDHPRRSISGDPPTRDKLILVPFGYFPVLESPTTRKHCWDLWWVREMDAEGKNEASQRYRRLMRRLFVEVHKAFDAGEDFDISVDDGAPITGYGHVLRLGDEP
jgi:hypothetical protein